MRRGRAIAAAATVLTGLGVAAGVYLQGGSTLIAVDQSPDRRERVELYSATRWQTLREPEADLLGYAKLVDAGGVTLGVSGAFELSGHSEIVWRADRVQVATSAIYDRASRRWTVLQ